VGLITLILPCLPGVVDRFAELQELKLLEAVAVFACDRSCSSKFCSDEEMPVSLARRLPRTLLLCLGVPLAELLALAFAGVCLWP